MKNPPAPNLTYTPRLFNLPTVDTSTLSFDHPASDQPREHYPYVFEDDVLIALDVALATHRPLLVSGSPGTGKSTLARAMARILDRRFLPLVITSRTRLEHLTCDYDSLRRLHHAQAAREGEASLPDWAYREPGLLWWAFNRDTARRRGASLQQCLALENAEKHRYQPPKEPTESDDAGHETNVVVLLDEIDKAEPDVPNDLLEPMDRRRFHVFGEEIAAPDDLEMLVVITTNGERNLPPAFLRRCVALQLKDIDQTRLVKVARHHYGDGDLELYAAVAAKVIEIRKAAEDQGRRPPSTSEFLDGVRACKRLGLTPKSKVWQRVAESTLVKQNTH